MSEQNVVQKSASRNTSIHDLASIRLAREGHEWRRALLASDLPDGTVRIGCAISEYFINSKTGSCFASHETIATRCGKTRRGVQAAIKRLVDAGFLRVERRGYQQTNLTYLALPAGRQMCTVERDDVHPGVRVMHTPVCTEPMNLTDDRTEEITSLDNSYREEILSPTAEIIPFEGKKEKDRISTDRPVRRATDDNAARCLIQKTAMCLLGYSIETVPKLSDGRYMDRWFIESLPQETLDRMIARCRAGQLTESEVALSVQSVWKEDRMINRGKIS